MIEALKAWIWRCAVALFGSAREDHWDNPGCNCGCEEWAYLYDEFVWETDRGYQGK